MCFIRGRALNAVHWHQKNDATNKASNTVPWERAGVRYGPVPSDLPGAVWWSLLAIISTLRPYREPRWPSAQPERAYDKDLRLLAASGMGVGQVGCDCAPALVGPVAAATCCLHGHRAPLPLLQPGRWGQRGCYARRWSARTGLLASGQPRARASHLRRPCGPRRALGTR